MMAHRSKKLVQLFAFLTISPFMVNPAAAQSITDYRWQNRLIIVVESQGQKLLDKVIEHSKQNSCEFKDRDLKIIHANSRSRTWAELPQSAKSEDGLLLIGYDGGIKDRSQDLSLLSRLNQTIDKMPMRRAELAERHNNNIC